MNRAALRRNLDQKVSKLFEKITITKGAFTKMNTYARIVSELADSHIECGGLMIGEHREGVPVVTDVVLLEGIVTNSSGLFDTVNTHREYLKARKGGKQVIGMWHSHGNYGVFHSSPDDGHLDVLFNKNNMTLPNLLLKTVKETLLGDEYIQIRESGLSIVREFGRNTYDVRFDVPDEKTKEVIKEALSHLKGVYVKETNGVPFAASIVINKESYDNPERIAEPMTGKTVYAEALAKHSGLKGNELKRRGLPLELVDDESETLDERSLYNEVCDKVTYQGEKLAVRAAQIESVPSEIEEKIVESVDQERTINDTMKTKVDYNSLAQKCSRIVKSPGYIKSINKKILHRYRLYQARRFLQKIGPDLAKMVYNQYVKEQNNGKTQKKAA